MKIESIKNINITLLFSEPLNHLLISQKDLLNKFKTGDEKNDKHTFVEAPGFKIFSFPNQQKEIIFEPVRVLLNDKTGAIPEETKIIDDFNNILDIDAVKQGRINSYGFNYDAVAIPESDNFNISELVSNKIANIENIKSAGVNLVFEKNNVVYILEIKPISSGQKFIAHFNAHFREDELPNQQILEEKIKKEFEEFKNILQKI